MELGRQIKRHRQEAKLSQEELANRVYVSRQTISNWENDKSYPDVNSLVLLSEIFQISLDKLIKGDIDVMKVTFESKEKEEKTEEQEGFLEKLLYGETMGMPNLLLAVLLVIAFAIFMYLT